jgi:hypothetical protein
MLRTSSLSALLPLVPFFGCGGATSTPAVPSPEAGVAQPPDGAAVPPDASTTRDAGDVLDAALFPEAGTSTACAIAIGGPSDKSFESSAARIYIGGTEIPFPQLECGDPTKGDPYWVFATMSPDDSTTAGVSLYTSRSPYATAVGGGTCVIAVSSNGTPLTGAELVKLWAASPVDASPVVTATFGNCANTSPVTVTSGWIRAVLDAPQ